MTSPLSLRRKLEFFRPRFKLLRVVQKGVLKPSMCLSTYIFIRGQKWLRRFFRSWSSRGFFDLKVDIQDELAIARHKVIFWSHTYIYFCIYDVGLIGFFITCCKSSNEPYFWVGVDVHSIMLVSFAVKKRLHEKKETIWNSSLMWLILS